MASPGDIKITGAYAAVSHDVFGVRQKKPFVRVVVKTEGQMPRRFDGLIKAGGRIVGAGGGGSTGSVGGRASRCYTFTVNLRDGRFYTATPSGETKGKKATVGSKQTIEFSSHDASGAAVKSTKTVTLRSERKGDETGKPLHC